MTNADQLRDRNRELSILNTIAQALNQQTNLSKALTIALNHIVDLFDLHTGWIWLLHVETGKPYLAAAHNLPPALRDNPARMEGSRYCYCLDQFQSDQMTGPANIGIITCSRLKDLITGTDGLKNHASVPLQAYDKPIGLLNVVGTDWRELTESELKLLHTISDMLGIAIERGRLFEQRAQQGMIQERNRLAREIHDTLAQTLTAISLKLETADALLDSGAAYTNVHELVMDALHLTRATLEDTRRSVLDLRAAPLEGRSLVEAIRSLCKDHTTSGMTVEVTLGEMRPLSPRLEMSLYRILQEALNNVHHHAQATTVHIRLTTIPETISLEIEDDGIGFDPDQLQHKQRFGLVGLNERVHLLGGVLNIESAPSIGTSLHISIPLGKHHD